MKFKDFYSDPLNEALVTFNKKVYPKFGNIVILAGGAGCYPKGTEYFNGNEWVKIEDYKNGDKVLQYDPLTQKAELITPKEYIGLDVDGFINIKNKRIDFTTSLNHKHLVINDKTKYYETKSANELLEKNKTNIRGNKCKLVTSFNYSGCGIDRTEKDIRLQIAIMADGYKLPQENKFRMSFKRKHKIDRFRELLTLNNIEYREYIDNGFTRFEFYFINHEKEFESYWYNCTKEQLEIVTDEVLKWDGSITERGKRKNSYSFSTTSEKTKDFVQFSFSALNKNCSVYDYKKEGCKLCYDLRISHSNGIGISKNHRTDNTTMIEKIEHNENEKMYCFEVPSGFFVVRQNGHIVVSGNSGKGFIINNLLGIDGKVLDVDELKKLAMNMEYFRKKYPEMVSMSTDLLALKNSENVKKLHAIVDKEGLIKKREKTLMKSILSSDINRKPNIIFDVTLKNTKKLNHISDFANKLGYDKNNIHIVWVVNDGKIALEQNKKRDRVVPEDILIDTHKGASKTVIGLIGDSSYLRKRADGDLWLVFNRKGFDAKVFFKDVNQKGYSIKKNIPKKTLSIDKAFIVKVKESGNPIISTKDVFNNIKTKMFRVIKKADIKATEDFMKKIIKGKMFD